MLRLYFAYDDAQRALEKYGASLNVLPLPATVFLMQQDVINQYRYALDHYLTHPLDASFLQNSSLGTPYQKWAHFNNENFEHLGTSIFLLLRFTARLMHETAVKSLHTSSEYREAGDISNPYISMLVELSHHKKRFGIHILQDQRLTLTARRVGRCSEQIIGKSKKGEAGQYYIVKTDAIGNSTETPIDMETFRHLTDILTTETIDIKDRSVLKTLRAQGHTEISELEEKNRAFGVLCKSFYQNRNAIEHFTNLHPDWLS